METYFVNEAMNEAVKNFLDSKDKPNSVLHNNFLVVVIRTLSLIYGELDITNAYLTKNEKSLNVNLSKYGYPLNKIEEFKKHLQNFEDIEKTSEKPNPYFLIIEKILIDMFITKKVKFSVTEEEEKKFKQLLYSPSANHELIISYNFLHTKNEYEIINYFNEQNNLNSKVEVEQPKHLLSPEAYRVISKSYTDVKALSAMDVEKINEEVYKALKVNKYAINFEYLLEKAINDFYKNHLSSGNGYVDILLIMSVISTLIMGISIITFLII